MRTGEYYTFELNANVKREHVRYKNRYGITIAADLYLHKELDLSQQHSALVIGTPYGGVKEQGAGIYAQNMALRGFVAIVFDESYNGESGGEPRHASSPDIFTEDISAGVDFLGTLDYVDRERIGVIGICGSGGFALTAAQVDKRIKAVATTSMYDISSLNHYGFNRSMSKEDLQQHLEQDSQQRWRDVDNGYYELTPTFPKGVQTSVPDNLDPISHEFFEYYTLKRGYHPNSIGAFAIISQMDFANFPLLEYIDLISPRPILFIMGEKAHSRYFTEEAFKRALEPKELVIIPDARHIDLYDREDMIPFDKLESFFKKYLG